MLGLEGVDSRQRWCSLPNKSQMPEVHKAKTRHWLLRKERALLQGPLARTQEVRLSNRSRVQGDI